MEKRTGTCYQTALTACTILGTHKDWTLVHGIAVLQGGKYKGNEFGHAWLEKDGVVYDSETKTYAPKTLFYLAGEVSYTKKYTSSEGASMCVEQKTYGPWDDKILNLKY